jgi:hypothetical protein
LGKTVHRRASVVVARVDASSTTKQEEVRMKSLLALCAVLAAAVAPAAFANNGHGHAKGKAQTLALDRADCAGVATATQQVGTAKVKAKGQNGEGKGRGRNTRLDARVTVSSGMASTSYRIYLLQSTGAGTCSVAATGNVLTTDANGKGTANVRFSVGSLPAGSYGIQLVAPSTATVPGPGPFTDVLTTQFGIVLPAVSSHTHGHH